MRRLCASLALFAMSSNTVFAEQITIDGIARSASRMNVLARYCPGVITARAADYENAFVEIGENSFGKKKFDRLLVKEFQRRETEFEAQGQERWCADSENSLRETGIKDVFQ